MVSGGCLCPRKEHQQGAISAAKIPPTTASAGDAVGVGPRAAVGYRRMAPSAGKVFSLQTLGGSSLQNIFGSQLRESGNHAGVAQNGSRQQCRQPFAE